MWITRVSIANPVFATMMMVALCVLGLFSFNRLGVEQMPDITFPGAWIEVQYPGASPEAVEREIVKPLEEAVNSVAAARMLAVAKNSISPQIYWFSELRSGSARWPVMDVYSLASIQPMKSLSVPTSTKISGNKTTVKAIFTTCIFEKKACFIWKLYRAKVIEQLGIAGKFSEHDRFIGRTTVLSQDEHRKRDEDAEHRTPRGGGRKAPVM